MTVESFVSAIHSIYRRHDEFAPFFRKTTLEQIGENEFSITGILKPSNYAAKQLAWEIKRTALAASANSHGVFYKRIDVKVNFARKTANIHVVPPGPG